MIARAYSGDGGRYGTISRLLIVEGMLRTKRTLFSPAQHQMPQVHEYGNLSPAT